MAKTAKIILHLDSELSWRGGQQQLFYLINGLRKRNFVNFLACPRASALLERAKEEGISVFPLSLKGEWDIFSSLKIRKLIKHFKVDILHCHSSHAHAIGLMALLFIKDCRLIVSRRVDFPIRKNVLSNYKYKNVDKFIAISDGIKNVLLQGGVKENKITVVHDGIDIAHFQCQEQARSLFNELGLQEGNPVVGNVAALAPHKHQQNLLAAAKIVVQSIPTAQFLIVGEGELESELKELTKRLGIEKNVNFAGFRKDVPQLLTIFDVFVVSSYLEGLGSSTLEAMAAGLPVAATRTGGIPEIVQDGINGLLVPPRDSQSLATAMITLLSDKERRKTMGAASRKIVENFSVEKMVEGNSNVY